MVFHVLNRGVGRMRLFSKEGDYEAFERSIEKTLESCPMRICAYCLMPNHWHFVCWPERSGELGAFMQKLTVTHVRNWQEHRRRVGYGHVYQGRYKSFPVEADEYFSGDALRGAKRSTVEPRCPGRSVAVGKSVASRVWQAVRPQVA
jgi:putative transposase